MLTGPRKNTTCNRMKYNNLPDFRARPSTNEGNRSRASSLVMALGSCATASIAMAEPGLSAMARTRVDLFVKIAFVVIAVALVVLGILTAALILRSFKLTFWFYATSFLAAGAWAIIGWFTGVIPLLLAIAVFAGAGRTM